MSSVFVLRPLSLHRTWGFSIYISIIHFQKSEVVMKKITDQISKEIVAVCEGEILGIVTGAYADKKLTRVRGYKVASEEKEDAESLPLRRVLGDEDALTVRTLSFLKASEDPECPLGAKIVDTAGLCHGVLRDVLFEEESGVILSLLASNGEIAPERVVGFGDRVIVLRAPCHDGKIFRKRGVSRKRTPVDRLADTLLSFHVAPDAPAQEQKENSAEEELPAIYLEESESEEPPAFLFRDYAFLLGRKVTKTIGTEEDIVARAEDSVTPEVILRARERGKLVELTVNSRK